MEVTIGNSKLTGDFIKSFSKDISLSAVQLSTRRAWPTLSSNHFQELSNGWGPIYLIKHKCMIYNAGGYLYAEVCCLRNSEDLPHKKIFAIKAKKTPTECDCKALPEAHTVSYSIHKKGRSSAD